MEIKIVEAKTIEEALSRGTEVTGLTKDDIDWKKISDKSDNVKLKVFNRREIERMIRDMIKDFLLKFCGEGEVEITSYGSGRYKANIFTPKEDGALIGKNGKTLEAVQHIVSRIVHKIDKDIDVNIDVAGYREKREHNLRKKAIAFAEEVKRSGRPVSFEPMPAYLRRIIHISLQHDRNIRTYTTGEGELKKVTIAPARK